jgi:hypothetical protein
LIKPEQDTSWPLCSHVVAASIHGQHWCEEVANQIRAGEDLVHMGAPICVPYLPSENLYAECRIGDEVSPDKMPGVYRLYVIKNVPLVPAPHDREEIELTLWSQGEGRASICLTVRDWVRGLAGPRHIPCAFIRHGYAEIAKSQKFDAQQWEINDFFCATESACWFCFNAAQHVGDPNSFLDPTESKKSPQQLHIQGRLRQGT